jgi:hypothetical protein
MVMSAPPGGRHEFERPLVTGRVIINEQGPILTDASVHIWLDEVSFADAPATTLAETVIAHVRSDPGVETVVTFELYPASGAPDVDAGSDYAVRVWVDRDGDGRPGPSDLYSSERHPVLTRGFGNAVTISLDPTQRVPVDRRDGGE